MADLQRAREAKDRLRSELRERPGVNGIGLTKDDDGYAVQVNVQLADDATALPSSVDGVHVHIKVTGPITPASRPHLRTA
ncbi:hypothetical protein ACGIF2_10290 [Cellulomonas sp. P22]|uniref:hypothetical protein n=1 Tax=Cellulomonas sp. P22 TaxID=3373189 RepID=UPI0037BD9C46